MRLPPENAASIVIRENREEILRLKNLNKKLLEALKEVQWGGTCEIGMPECPCCFRLKPYNLNFNILEKGHDADCKLAAAIALAEKEEK